MSAVSFLFIMEMTHNHGITASVRWENTKERTLALIPKHKQEQQAALPDQLVFLRRELLRLELHDK